MRLIDADFEVAHWESALLNPTPDVSEKDRRTAPYIIDALKMAGTVKDAVEVVRCKDCKHFDDECCDRYADETLGYSHSTQPNFFCAVGERRTDEE